MLMAAARKKPGLVDIFKHTSWFQAIFHSVVTPSKKETAITGQMCNFLLLLFYYKQKQNFFFCFF